MCKNRRQCARPNSQFRLRCTWSQCLLSIYFCTLTVCWVFRSHTFCVVGAAFFSSFRFFFFLFCYNFWLHAFVELLIRFRCTRYAHYSLFTLKTLLTRRAWFCTNVHTLMHLDIKVFHCMHCTHDTLSLFSDDIQQHICDLYLFLLISLHLHKCMPHVQCTCACVFVCDSEHMTIPLIYFCAWLKYNIFRFNGFHYLPLKPWNLSCAPKEYKKSTNINSKQN